jgi:hypothetical protein
MSSQLPNSGAFRIQQALKDDLGFHDRVNSDILQNSLNAFGHAQVHLTKNVV